MLTSASNKPLFYTTMCFSYDKVVTCTFLLEIYTYKKRVANNPARKFPSGTKTAPPHLRTSL